MQKETKARRTRSDKGIIKFTERDQALLRLVREQYTLRLGQLQFQMCCSTSSARQWMTRQREAGYLRFAPILYKQTTYMWLTRTGLRQAGLEYGAWEPTPGNLDHLRSITEMRLWFARNCPDYKWIPEREIQFWLRQQGPRERTIHVPDAKIIVPNGAVVGLEVELNPKSRARTTDIMDLLLCDYAAAWYYVAPAARAIVDAARSDLHANVRERIHVDKLHHVTGDATTRAQA